MITIYSDGSALGNPGPGGWGFIALDADVILTEQSGGEFDTTNNRMELSAVIAALQWLLESKGIEFTRQGELIRSPGVGLFTSQVQSTNDIDDKYDEPVIIFTDSNYVKLGITERIETWIRRSWRLSKGGKLVKNADLWQQLHRLAGYFSELDRKRVKAHNGNTRNEKVDSLARNAAGNFIS